MVKKPIKYRLVCLDEIMAKDLFMIDCQVCERPINAIRCHGKCPICNTQLECPCLKENE